MDGLVADAEGGDHVAGNYPQTLLPLENGGLDTGTAQEIGGGDAVGPPPMMAAFRPSVTLAGGWMEAM